MGVPLSTLLSQALVAFTIEVDNAFEQTMPHCTTASIKARLPTTGPWLTSYAMWANFLQHVEPEGTPLEDVRQLARATPEALHVMAGGMHRWGYVTLQGSTMKGTVRPTTAGLQAQQTWAPLAGEVEQRWEQRFGDDAVAALRSALRAVEAERALDLPEYLPIARYGPGLAVELPTERRTDDAPAPILLSSLARVLLALTVDVEARPEARVSLAFAANLLRVLDVDEPVLERDLPRRSGTSKEGHASMLTAAAKQGLVTRIAKPKSVRLTDLGAGARDGVAAAQAAVEAAWGPAAVDPIRDALGPIVGDGTLPGSPLAAGLLPPPPGTWRADALVADTLPHHPMVLHRGGYPDGA